MSEKLKRWWLTVSATIVGVWTALDPVTQQAIVHQVSSFVHHYPRLFSIFSAAAVIAADFKTAPNAPKQEPYLGGRL